jgi:hypothetical protein
MKQNPASLPAKGGMKQNPPKEDLKTVLCRISRKTLFLGMLTLYIDEKTSAGKSLLEYALKLKAPSKSIRIRKSTGTLSDEEMALPGTAPSAAELDKWLTLPDKDKGTSGEVARKRLLKKFRKEFQSGQS